MKYGFGRAFSKRELQWLKPKVDIGRILGDELYFDNERREMNGGIVKAIERLTGEDDGIEVNAKGIATVLYNGGLEGVLNP